MELAIWPVILLLAHLNSGQLTKLLLINYSTKILKPLVLSFISQMESTSVSSERSGQSAVLEQEDRLRTRPNRAVRFA